ncbi:MAG: endonuclease/exonuclease/phosphatase family protein [Verrucomicrobiota bacterium]|nr:endonuclease/exonuclease/phosphatase family protein [Verrucomicrobiota bacterium]
MKLPTVCLLIGLLLANTLSAAREFTVLTYNVENLFDLDGISQYDDYAQTAKGAARAPWNAARLYSKVTNIAPVLKRFNKGHGPEVVVFQEFERDQSPQSTITDWAAFEKDYGSQKLETLMDENHWAAISSWPAEAYLYKALHEAGITGYTVARPAFTPEDGKKAPHKNVVFSKFPVTAVKQHPIRDARDILEVHLSVDGQELVIMDNHWKSGASDVKTEVTRVANAKVLRDRVAELLKANPALPILLAGDFNSHYDQRLLVPEAKETGIDNTLQAGSDEPTLHREQGYHLYNLWYELPAAKRRSDVYKGRWGTLMQMIITPGLCDGKGVDYVDNSFFVAVFPGLNAEPIWNTPISWQQFGKGFGCSDHLPIGAKFVVYAEGQGTTKTFTQTTATPEPASVAVVDYSILNKRKVPSANELKNQSDDELGRSFGQVFLIDAPLASTRPLAVRYGERTFELYSYLPEVLNQLKQIPEGKRIRCYGMLEEYKGRVQFMVCSGDWLK